MSEAAASALQAAVPALRDVVAPAAAALCQEPAAQALVLEAAADLRGGIARAIAGQPEFAAFLGRRRDLLQRLRDAGPGVLANTAPGLAHWRPSDPLDLERALDELRLLRREQTAFAACLYFAGQADFDTVSGYLSDLAQAIARSALELALLHAPVRRKPPFAVLGMGKIAGREFTFHSDLDLIFLTEGDADALEAASRIGQRMIAYLTTMTGAGIAYAVDTRLRPSGRQGTLVTSFEAFERYQCESAATWEHLALLRARAIAGEVDAAQTLLDRVRQNLLRNHPSPWGELADMRARVESERSHADPGRIAFKTGPGGLMDVDFLAGGGLLERGARGCPGLPSVPAMLRRAARGPRVDALLDGYDFLRRVEAAARWTAGRAVEDLATDADALGLLCELSGTDEDAAAFRNRLDATLAANQRAFAAVTGAGSIAALESGPPL